MIFCVSSIQSLGCTFLDWSLHFLSGQDYFYSTKSQSWIELKQNPLSELNSHGHKKNHPPGSANSIKCIDLLSQLDSNKLYSLYPVQLDIVAAINNLDYTIDQLKDPEVFNKVKNFQSQDYLKTFKHCVDNNVKIIFLAMAPEVSLYRIKIRQLDRFLTKNQAPSSTDDLVEELQKIFFSDSIDTWKNLGLTNIWDVRERMALDSRPFDYQMDPVLPMPHLRIDCRDWWLQGPKVISKALTFLGLTVDADRLEQWLPIYYQWQAIQAAAVEFCYYIDHIVDAIVKNIYFEIDLSFEQEAVVQHCLIYKHNLNLKTWELKKFPNNTQDLHKLLEPNIHPVQDIYSRLTT